MQISILVLLILLAAVFIVGYLVGANNPLSSVKKKIQDEAKGLLKKLPLILVPIVLLLSSCQQYGSAIKGTYTSTGSDCVFAPLDSTWRASAAKGWVAIDSSHAGNPMMCTVWVKVDPTWRQKWQIAHANGSATTAYILWILAFAAIVFGVIMGNKGGSAPVVVGSFLLAIVFCWFAFSSIDWAITKEAAMPKSMYDNLMQTDGSLEGYWDANLLK